MGEFAHEGIPNAWGQPGVLSIYVDTTEAEEEHPQRRVVCIDTSMCETTLEPDAAEALIERLRMAISEARNGERPLREVRDLIGARAYNCLAGQLHMRTVEGVARLTDEEMMRAHNFGMTSLERVRAVIGYA